MPTRRMLFRPHTMAGGRVITNRGCGTGMGSLLLDKGGSGGGSSYYSMEDYLATTGGRGLGAGHSFSHRPAIAKKSFGLGLGGAIEDKLSRLMVKPEIKLRKPKNIQFNM